MLTMRHVDFGVPDMLVSDFYDRIGVNIRLGEIESDYKYSGQVVDALDYIGIDLVRDQSPPTAAGDTAEGQITGAFNICC